MHHFQTTALRYLFSKEDFCLFVENLIFISSSKSLVTKSMYLIFICVFFVFFLLAELNKEKRHGRFHTVYESFIRGVVSMRSYTQTIRDEHEVSFRLRQFLFYVAQFPAVEFKGYAHKPLR